MQDPSKCVFYDCSLHTGIVTAQDLQFTVIKSRKCGFPEHTALCCMSVCHCAEKHLFCYNCWEDIVLQQWCQTTNLKMRKCIACTPDSEPASPDSACSFGSVEELPLVKAATWNLIVNVETSPEAGRIEAKYTDEQGVTKYYAGPEDVDTFEDIGIPALIQDAVAKQAMY